MVCSVEFLKQTGNNLSKNPLLFYTLIKQRARGTTDILYVTSKYYNTEELVPTWCTIPSLYVYFYSLHVTGNCAHHQEK
jgi:hypothetical protein